MPGDPFQRFQPGATSIPAELLNAMVDLVKRDRARAMPQVKGQSSPPLAPTLCYLQNGSGADVDRFGVLGIDSPVVSPTDNADTFASLIALKGVKPTTDHEDGKFVVLLEPTANNGVRTAAIGGVTICKINVTDAAHKYAKAKADTTAALVSADAGPCVIMWKQSGTGDGKWAVVRFGGGGAAPGVKWGKLTALWVPGQSTVRLQPVKDAAANPFPSPVPDPIDVAIIMPRNAVPAYLYGEVNDLFAYEDLGGGAGYLLKNPQTTPIPARKWEVIQNVGDAPTAPQWASDFMRAHNLVP